MTEGNKARFDGRIKKLVNQNPAYTEESGGMAADLLYRYRVRWGEPASYLLSQAVLLGLNCITLAYLQEKFSSIGFLSPLSCIASVALWAYAAGTLRHYRGNLLAYQRLQGKQWERDAAG